MLLIYAARHYRELSAQNELRPQDVMRILVHYHAYGDAAKVAEPRGQAQRAHPRADRPAAKRTKSGRIEAEYQAQADKLAALDAELADARARRSPRRRRKPNEKRAEAVVTRLEKQREKVAAKIAERDERIAEARRRAEDDRKDVVTVGEELIALYADPDELLKHARVVGLDEIEENEFNLNIPRYVDTFEPEPRVEVKDALRRLRNAENNVQLAEEELTDTIKEHRLWRLRLR